MSPARKRKDGKLHTFCYCPHIPNASAQAHGRYYAKTPAKTYIFAGVHNFDDGESGIRTHGDISATLDFESSALDQLSHLSKLACRAYSALCMARSQDLSAMLTQHCTQRNRKALFVSLVCQPPSLFAIDPSFLLSPGESTRLFA